MLTPALELLRELRDREAVIQTIDGKLRVRAPAGMLTEYLKGQIVTHKSELLRLLAEAVDLLNSRGVRLIRRRDQFVIGIWREADEHGVRAALEVVGLGEAEVLYLDDPRADIPERYRH